MPQASLQGWLNKPKDPQAIAPAKLLLSQGTNRGAIHVPKNEISTTQEALSGESNGECCKGNEPKLTAISNKRTFFLNVELRACLKNDIPRLKRLNSLLLPIPYPESFYREIIEDSLISNITLVAMWHDGADAASKQGGHLIGAIRCRLFAHPPSPAPNSWQENKGPMLYLSTLVLHSPYRSLGIATRMLEILTKRAVDAYGVTSVGAHVWEANAEGLNWYRRRGFREVGKEEGYYRRLKPSGAVVMQKDLGVLDLMGG